MSPRHASELSHDPGARNGSAPEVIGSRVREERLAQKIGVRELARRVGVSASLISQVELGKASPSVGTLYAIVNELGLSLDELFLRDHAERRSSQVAIELEDSSSPIPLRPRQNAVPPSPAPPAGDGAASRGSGRIPPVVRRGDAKVIQLASGVRWERLTPETPQDVDFLEVTYGVGSESCAEDSLMRHSGHEYGHVLEGRMGVTVGFETYELEPGDSVAFDSTMPHRLFTIGDAPVRALWVVVGRRGDPRVHH